MTETKKMYTKKEIKQHIKEAEETKRHEYAVLAIAKMMYNNGIHERDGW